MNFNQKVYEIVKEIPKGKVTTYGQIAEKLRIENGELRINARMVGWVLHANRSADVPCHRVVDRNGRVAPNFAFYGWREQKRRLEAEGIKFVDDMHVDLSEQGSTLGSTKGRTL